MADFQGTPGNDVLTGGPEEDFFEGSKGNDTIDGAGNSGEESDIINYSNGAVTQGIYFNGTSSARDGVAAYTVDKGSDGVDSISGIEGVFATNFDDTVILELGGVDEDQPPIADAGGNDYIEAFDPTGNTEGVDIIVGSGNDTYIGAGLNRGGRLRFEDWINDSAGAHQQGAQVTFTGEDEGTIIDPWGGNDTFEGFQRITGSELGDTFIGAEGEQRLHGYGGNDTLSGGADDDRIFGGNGADTLDGGDGWDHVDYDDDTDANSVGVIIDVAAGTGRGVDGMVDQISNFESFEGSVLDDVIDASMGDEDYDLQGKEGNDTLIGNDGDNWIEPGQGNDSIVGGGGFDTMDYRDEPEDGGTAGINVNFATGTATDSFGNTDTFSGIEGIRATQLNDVIDGSGTTSRIELRGYEGNDTLIGGTGNDRLDGGDGDDYIDGSAGDTERGWGDYITPGLGADTVLGAEALYRDGDGTDISYDNVEGTGGIILTVGNDGTGTAVSRNAGMVDDTFTFMHYFTGSNDDDTMTSTDTNDNGQGWIGLGGDDTIHGGEGHDRIIYRDDVWNGGENGVTVDLAVGTATDGFGDTDTFTGIESVQATQFRDELYGDDNNNDLEGREGGDQLFGRGGDDWMDGGEGSDNLDGGEGYDVAYFDADFADFSFSTNPDGTFEVTDNVGNFGSNTLTNMEAVRFRDTDDDITIESILAGVTDGDDVLDFSDASEGVEIDGGPGNDTITGSPFEDELRGGEGDDTIIGNGGDENLYGGPGNDTIDAKTGDEENDDEWDFIDPGEGNDTIIGDGTDYVWYRDIADTDTGDGVFGLTVDLAAGTAKGKSDGTKSDTLTGISGVGGTDLDDVLLGGSDNNGGDEYFEGRNGDDTINGGAGEDFVSYYWDGGPNGIDVNMATGRVVGTYGDIDTLISIEGVRGTEMADTFMGSDRNDDFEGSAGNDTFDGGAGVYDRVSYQDDDRRGGNAGITATLASGTIIDGFGDTDTVSNIEWVRGTIHADMMTAADGVNTLFSGSDGDDDLNGASGSDRLYGGRDNDLLSGAAGSDYLWGGDGDNTLDGGDGVDTAAYSEDRADLTITATADGFTVQHAEGTDTLTSIESFALDDGTYSANQIANGTSNDADVVDVSGDAAGADIDLGGGDDMVTGSAFDDVFDAGLGDDVVDGGAGNDIITAAQGNNTLSGGEGDDTVAALSGSNTLDGGAGSDVLQGGIGADVLTGGAGNDTLIGDPMGLGLGGADTLEGGAGDDMLTGGVGSDTFVFRAGDGVDVIGNGAADFEAGLDHVRLVGMGYADAAAALANVTDVGGVAVFADAAQGLSITFTGLTTADLSVDDFLIA